jgi:DNA-binding NtrC family response regulator
MIQQDNLPRPQRFKEAVQRELRRRMRPGDVDELDQVAERFVELLLEGDEQVAVRLILELFSREDGRVDQHFAFADSQPLHFVMRLQDSRESPLDGFAGESTVGATS